MNIHVESVHEGKKPFKCEICDYIQLFLKSHVESVRGEKKAFIDLIDVYLLENDYIYNIEL